IVLLLVAVPVLRALLARDLHPIFGERATPRVANSPNRERDPNRDPNRERDDPRPVAWWWLGAGAVVAVALATTPGLSGHASTGDVVPIAVTTDAIHVLAMAIWIGGLVALANVLLPGRTARELDGALPRWSHVGLACVGAIVATGAFQTWRQVGSL